MAAFSRRTSRVRAESRRPNTQAADPPTPPLDPADHVVAAAERIVGDAWIQQLIKHRDEARARMQIALVQFDNARRALNEAQRERAPAMIATAHADVEETLATAHRAAADFDHVQQGLVLELDMLAWRSVERTVNACIADNDRRWIPTAVAMPHTGRDFCREILRHGPVERCATCPVAELGHGDLLTSFLPR